MNATTMNMLLLVFFIGLIYFMMIRPQRKKDKEDKAMRASLVVGDEIMTIGGVVGKVTKITEKTVVIATAERTKIEFVKTAISSITKKNGEAPKKAAPVVDDADESASNVSRDKKVTPKKLTKKSDTADETAVEETTEEA